MPQAPPTLTVCSMCGRATVGRRTCGCAQRQRRSATPMPRPSSAQRGYDYAWQRFRLRYLAAHPWCVDCEEEGRLVPAQEIHHLTRLRAAPERKYDENNLRALCRRHHRQRTARGE